MTRFRAVNTRDLAEQQHLPHTDIDTPLPQRATSALHHHTRRACTYNPYTHYTCTFHLLPRYVRAGRYWRAFIQTLGALLHTF